MNKVQKHLGNIYCPARPLRPDTSVPEVWSKHGEAAFRL